MLGKTARLREAKEEAQKEIEAYRKQRELNFQEQQRKVRHNYRPIVEPCNYYCVRFYLT